MNKYLLEGLASKETAVLRYWGVKHDQITKKGGRPER